MFDPQPLSELL